jgi:nitrate reductase NapAB chaperone NapD
MLLALIFLLSYIPPSKSAVGVGSVVIAAKLAVVPSVVKNLPALPVCDGKASIGAQLIPVAAAEFTVKA